MQKNKKFYWVLIILLLSLVTIIIYENKPKNNIDLKTTKETEINETEWNIYSNKKLGLKELKYPSDMYINESQDSVFISKIPFDDPKQQSSAGIMSRIAIYQEKNKNIDEMLKVYKTGQYTEANISEIEIGGKKGFKITYKGGYSGEKNFVYLLKDNISNNILKIHYTDTYEKIFDEIINSIVYY